MDGIGRAAVAENASWRALVAGGGQFGPRLDEPAPHPAVLPGPRRRRWGTRWRCCPAARTRSWRIAFPGVPVVGYEHGDTLDNAFAHGAEPLGPLRVWLCQLDAAAALAAFLNARTSASVSPLVTSAIDRREPRSP
jgi:hypothetical protein